MSRRPKLTPAVEEPIIPGIRPAVLLAAGFEQETVVDVFTRECLAIQADRKLSGTNVSIILDSIAATRSYPKKITVDNGTEFFSQAMDRWAHLHEVKLDFIRPERPMENGFIESFNGKLRDECLSAELFSDLVDARKKLDAWRQNQWSDKSGQVRRPSLRGRVLKGSSALSRHGPR